ncbi:hypothetical protein LX32DRAFT_652127 [Colletotrichum zoysiae]|uniref:Uncharacterized protein n=1 Tax=Colletotrichum zoysiae TaxID=1216348 RepID=A0AAD9HKL2_9PEZI|nr:hypothetical protein LX32DRAFT_652127 [Colletotrichum zoysiae]
MALICCLYMGHSHTHASRGASMCEKHGVFPVSAVYSLRVLLTLKKAALLLKELGVVKLTLGLAGVISLYKVKYKEKASIGSLKLDRHLVIRLVKSNLITAFSLLLSKRLKLEKALYLVIVEILYLLKAKVVIVVPLAYLLKI